MTARPRPKPLSTGDLTILVFTGGQAPDTLNTRGEKLEAHDVHGYPPG